MLPVLYTVLQLVGFQSFARCHASSNRSVRFDSLYDLNIVCHVIGLLVTVAVCGILQNFLAVLRKPCEVEGEGPGPVFPTVFAGAEQGDMPEAGFLAFADKVL